MKLRSTLLLSVAFLALNASQADAAAFAGVYTFTGTTGDTASFAYNGTSIDNVVVGNLLKVGVTSSSSTGNSRANTWPTGATSGSDTFTGSVDLGMYFEFSLTAAAGYEIDMGSITFGIGRSAAGPRQWEWRSDTDSYAATIGTYTTVHASLSNTGGVLTNPDANSSWTANVLDVSETSFDGLSAVTFRLYAFNAELASGTGGLQGPLSFSGDVNAVPETSAALLGSLAMLGLLRRRR